MPKSSRRRNLYYLSPPDGSPASRFEYAVEVGDTQAVRKVIVRHKRIPKWLTPTLLYRLLIASVYHRDKMMVALLLKLRPVLDLENESERTSSPLWSAVMYCQQREIARLLIDAGANLNKRLGPNASHDPECTMLHYLLAAYIPPVESRNLINLLIERGADVNAVDSKGRTPLHYAVALGENEITSKLLSNGADVNAKNVKGVTPFLLVCQSSSTKEIVKLLIENEADIFAQTPDGCNALHVLANSFFEGPDNLAEILLKRGVSLRVIDNAKQYTPLHCAVLNGKEKLTKIFLEHGADVNGWEGCREPPLFLAAARKSPKIVKMLISRGAKLKSKTDTGQTALHIACKNEQEENISALLRYEAAINALDDEGATPFSLIEKKNLSGSIQVMIRTIAKHTVLNKPTNKIDLGIINEYPELQEFYDNCLKEMDKMKQLKLFDNITYFSLFSKNEARLALLFRNYKIKVSLRVKKINSLLPIYSGDLNRAIRTAKLLNKDSYRIEHILNDIFFNVFPDTVIRQILLELLVLDTIHKEN